ncbi:hypothetical protein WSM22_40820 [Cytophagales bacterium WSM2-2]|nr:hypothetical protein WSM22_40820 [Cytophagales bacterium WSM2-2]
MGPVVIVIYQYKIIMKAITITYWIFTGLLTALCLLSSILDISHAPDAVALIKHLGYPLYFVTFIGVVRLFGIGAVLVQGYPKLKEWAYAGLFFDMAGAVYSHVATGDSFGVFAPAFIGVLLVAGSYFFYRKRAY